MSWRNCVTERGRNKNRGEIINFLDIFNLKNIHFVTFAIKN